MAVANVTPQSERPAGDTHVQLAPPVGIGGSLGGGAELVDPAGGELGGDDGPDCRRHRERPERDQPEPSIAGCRVRQHRLTAGDHHQDGSLRPPVEHGQPGRLLGAGIHVGSLPPPRRVVRRHHRLTAHGF